MRILALALAAVALTVAAPASAQVVTTNYSISGSQTSGTFTLDFDTPTTTYSLTGLDLTVFNASWSTSNSGIVTDGSNLVIGGDPFGVDGIGGSGNDFFFEFDPTSTDQSSTVFYQIDGILGFFEDDVTIKQVESATAVPEAATWAMMLVGFAGIGFAMRQTRRLATA
jgi:hypothetical protein